jgi:hypothetical protein
MESTLLSLILELLDFSNSQAIGNRKLGVAELGYDLGRWGDKRIRG